MKNENYPKSSEFETISDNVLEIKKQELIKAAIKQPGIFAMPPETLNKNVIRCLELFEIKKNEFIKAGLNFPSLFI